MARSRERLGKATDRIREDVGVSEEIELDVQGMTCASCAARVEKVLNRQA
ncbi:MAG: cation transporter, partial [Actinomycetota bacterium]